MMNDRRMEWLHADSELDVVPRFGHFSREIFIKASK
jgi:hypothetical protein